MKFRCSETLPVFLSFFFSSAVVQERETYISVNAGTCNSNFMAGQIIWHKCHRVQAACWQHLPLKASRGLSLYYILFLSFILNHTETFCIFFPCHLPPCPASTSCTPLPSFPPSRCAVFCILVPISVWYGSSEGLEGEGGSAETERGTAQISWDGDTELVKVR